MSDGLYVVEMKWDEKGTTWRELFGPYRNRAAQVIAWYLKQHGERKSPWVRVIALRDSLPYTHEVGGVEWTV